jgi:hypothetical protein
VSSLGIEVIRQWANFISTQERLAGIPFIIDDDHRRPMDNDLYKEPDGRRYSDLRNWMKAVFWPRSVS